MGGSAVNRKCWRPFSITLGRKNDEDDDDQKAPPLIPSLPPSPQPGLGRLLAVTDSNTAQSSAAPT